MKTKFFITIILIAAFLTGVCATKNGSYKATIIAESKGTAVSYQNMQDAVSVLRKRLIFYGFNQENIRLDIKSDTISLVLAKNENIDPEAIRSLITNSDKLEFWETFENSELTGAMAKANSVEPLYGMLRPMIDSEGKPKSSCLIGLSEGKDTSLVIRYMNKPEIKALFPRNIKFLWSKKPYRYFPKENLYELHALRVTSSTGKAPLDGSDIVDAMPVKGYDGKFTIRLTMSSEGTKIWSAVTRSNIGRCIAIVVNNHVRAYPVVQSEIAGGKTEISGDYTAEEAEIMANILKSGQLPLKLRIIDEQK